MSFSKLFCHTMDAAIHQVLPQTSPKESNPDQLIAASKWKLLRNVVQAVSRFKSTEVKVVDDVEDLISEIRFCATSSQFNRMLSSREYYVRDAINEHKVSELLFRYIRLGNINDLRRTEEIISNDPRIFIRSKVDDEFLVNKCNLLGHTPLYEASRQGNLEAMELLLKYGANPHLLSRIDLNEYESVLEVACRWNHIKIVKTLLNCSVWTVKEINNSLKVACNESIKLTLLDYLNKHYVRKIFCCKMRYK